MNIQALLTQATNLHQAGQAAEAAPLYRRVFKVTKDQGVANLLTIALDQSGDPAGAEAILKKAVGAAGAFEPLLNLGWLLMRRQAVADAVPYLSCCVEQESPAGKANNLLVEALISLGRIGEATAPQLRLCQAEPARPAPWLRLIALLNAAGDPVTAARVSTEAVRHCPGSAELQQQCGIARAEAGDAASGTAPLLRAVILKPGWGDAVDNLGILLRRAGDTGHAAIAGFWAATMKPKAASTHANLAQALLDLGRFEAAHATALTAHQLEPLNDLAAGTLGIARRGLKDSAGAGAMERRALIASPASGQALNNAGGGIKSDGDLKAAANWFRRAAIAEPNLVDAQRNLAATMTDMTDMAGARAALDAAMALDPKDAGLAMRAALTYPTILDNVEQIEPIRREIIARMTALRSSGLRLLDPLRQVGMPNFYLAYHGLNDREIQSEIAATYLALCPDLAAVAGHCSNPSAKPAGARLKIGFISKFFHSHSVRFISEGIITGLDRALFEVHVIANRPEEEVNLFPDGARADGHWVFTEDLAATRDLVARLELDILVYGDIGMELLTYYLAFSRLAPVQCALQGHPVTTGIPAMDYFICSDLQELAEADDHYTEAVVRLADIPVRYLELQPPATVTRAEFDLPEDKHLYFCPQTLFKFRPGFDQILAGILQSDPDALILLLRDTQPLRTEQLHARLARLIPDADTRIRWIERQPAARYYGLLQCCEVMLDTSHFCGGNTTIQALGLGVPPVTLPGEFVRGRMTIGWLNAIDMAEDLAASDGEDYVRIAVRLAKDADWRAEIVERIAERRDQLFEQTSFIHELERFFKAAHTQANQARARLRWLERDQT
jgi:protein O-GlcNAc transferase